MLEKKNRFSFISSFKLLSKLLYISKRLNPNSGVFLRLSFSRGEGLRDQNPCIIPNFFN
jgi:hypothetical protein